MLGLLQYKPGWKAFGDLAETWGQPPSSYAVLAVLRGLTQQCWQAGEDLAASSSNSPAPESSATLVEPLLDVIPRTIGDLAAPPAAPTAPQQGTASSSKGSKWAPASLAPPAPASKWPAVDAELAAAALELLLACSEAATAAQQGYGNSQQQLAAGVKALLQTLCSAQQPLTPEVCYLLMEAFSHNPEVEAWAMDSFVCVGPTSGLLAVFEEQGYGQGSELPLLLQPRQLDDQQPADGGQGKAGAREVLTGGFPQPGTAIYEADPEYMQASRQRQQRLEDLRRVRSWEALQRHLLSHGWVVKRDQNHIIYVLGEADLPPNLLKQMFTHPKSASDCRSLLAARCQLARIYKRLEHVHQQNYLQQKEHSAYMQLV